jgi:hypothetical protein
MTERRSTPIWDPGCAPDTFTDECVSIDMMGSNARLTFVVPMFDTDEDGARVIKERRVIARLVVPITELDRIARAMSSRHRVLSIEDMPREAFGEVAN